MDTNNHSELSALRDEIDKNDDALLHLFINRMRLVAKVSEYKIKNDVSTLDNGREERILARVSENSGEFAPYAQALFKELFKLSRNYQDENRGDEIK